ncbi:helix-turn-helix domain-containing protein [Sulfitobacter albidus]|uniref:Helix-turn-helix domain-containing protein n=2 Tax=Sulfitobacter albidus TaxID=2829501 RepID=A0A975JGE1_9RHOB|nr:helix-turn-helix domain-containing protein [Sulfitobacter albidus]
MPEWVPQPIQNYLGHTEMGIPIRALARHQGCHASTILRQIRRIETLRDDPLVDGMLTTLGLRNPAEGTAPAEGEDPIAWAEGFRLLGKLCERGAVLAVAAEMDKAVILRVLPGGESARTGVVDRSVAEALALKGWITSDNPGRITRYTITPAGRNACAELSATVDADQTAGPVETAQRPGIGRIRYSAQESPVSALARRRDKDGQQFLSDAQVRAAEQLREDFELARLGPRLKSVLEAFQTTLDVTLLPNRPEAGTPAGRAEARVIQALQDLGPGLSEVALRCCCFLEGLESAEKRLGWSARSGKIVLRIALTRLERYYATTIGASSAMIG